jgi:hypothetical protein
MEKVAAEARACGEVNYVGTVLALACFVCPFSPTPVLKLISSFPSWHLHQNHQSYTTYHLWQLPLPRQQGQFTQLQKQQHSWLLNLVESNVKVQELGSSVSPHILVRADDSITTGDDSKWIPPKTRSKQRRWGG